MRDRSVSPPAPAVRVTRRQLAKAEEEREKSRDRETVLAQAGPGLYGEVKGENGREVNGEMKKDETEEYDASTSAPTSTPATSQPPATGSEDQPPAETSIAEAPKSEDQPTTLRSPAKSARKSPTKPPAAPTTRPTNSIAAIDALEEALEAVDKALPTVVAVSPSKLRRAASTTKPTAKTRASVAPRSSASRPSTVRKPSMPTPADATPATASKTPAVARKSSVLSRPSMRVSSRDSSAKPPPTDPTTGPKTEPTDYLAQRRAARPVSISFPTPPKPAKSSKPPTRSTFQLPGEAMAAKLKAQKEERLKREAEGGKSDDVEKKEFVPPVVARSKKAPTMPAFSLPGEAVAAKLKAQREERMKREEDEAEKEQKREFKARPVPRKSSAPVVKPTAASRARESLMHAAGSEGAEKNAEANGVDIKPLKRTSSVQLSHEKRVSTRVSKRPSTAPLNPPSTISEKPKPTHSAKRTLYTTTNGTSTSKPRVSSITSHATSAAKPAVTVAAAATQKLKGKEVFNRDKLEKQERERVRREKEDAAKQARAAAAERGRQASREWAEKQKIRKMAAATVVAKVEEGMVSA